MKIKVTYLNGTEKVFKDIETVIERGSRLMMYEYTALPEEYIILKPQLVDSVEIMAGKEV